MYPPGREGVTAELADPCFTEVSISHAVLVVRRRSGSHSKGYNIVHYMCWLQRGGVCLFHREGTLKMVEAEKVLLSLSSPFLYKWGFQGG